MPTHRTSLGYLAWFLFLAVFTFVSTLAVYGIGYLRTDLPTFWTMVRQRHFGDPCIGVQTTTDNVARLVYIQPGSPAKASHFQVGDRIVVLNGRRVRDIDDLTTFIGFEHPGEVVGIEVRRSGFLGIRETLSWGVRLGYYEGETCIPFPKGG